MRDWVNKLDRRQKPYEAKLREYRERLADLPEDIWKAGLQEYLRKDDLPEQQMKAEQQKCWENNSDYAFFVLFCWWNLILKNLSIFLPSEKYLLPTDLTFRACFLGVTIIGIILFIFQCK